MKKIMLLLAVLTCAISTHAGREGHGGDLVKCVASSENNFDGYYVLDEVVGSTILSTSVKKYTEKDLDTKMKSIIESIEVKSSYLGGALRNFYLDFKEQFIEEKKPDVILAREWKIVTTPLIPLEDESLVNELPLNCRSGISQAIVRKSVGLKKQYFVNKRKLISLIPEESLSWLIVHEFLWDFTQDVEVVRQLNSYFHSEEMIVDEKKYFLDYLRSYHLEKMHLIAHEWDFYVLRANDKISISHRLVSDSNIPNFKIELGIGYNNTNLNGKKAQFTKTNLLINSKNYSLVEMGSVMPLFKGMSPDVIYKSIEIYKVNGHKYGYATSEDYYKEYSKIKGETLKLEVRYYVNGKLVREDETILDTSVGAFDFFLAEHEMNLHFLRY